MTSYLVDGADAPAIDAARPLQPRVSRLIDLLDDADPLAAYAAMRGLEQHPPLLESPQLIRMLLSPENPATASGFRFQLLRWLLARERADADGDDSEDSDEGDDGERSPVLMVAMLRHVDALHDVALTRVRESLLSPRQSSCVYELLSFVSELTEQLAKSDLVSTQNCSFDAFAAALMDAFAGGDVDFVGLPTFVSNAATACLHSLLRLLRVRSPTGVPLVKEREWLRRLLQLVVGEQSSLTQFALDLLQEQRLENRLGVKHASQESFVSATSRFPFVQTWIAFASSAALALVENRASLVEEDWALVQTAAVWYPGRLGVDASANTRVYRLPDRTTLLAVLSEQDDVMVDVLRTLLQLAVELDPDLLFADILKTLGHDHLVLLDLLTSSETTMLEYLLRYLRRLGVNWEASRALLCGPSAASDATSDDISDNNSADNSSFLSNEQKHRHPLDDMMGVLIRLRFEIEKQVAAQMFPYNPKPLLRRLLYIEELYDGV